MLAVRDSGNASRSIVGASVRDAGGVLRTIQSIAVRDASNTLHTVFTSLRASALPASVTAYIDAALGTSATTNPATATPIGGQGPFTYAWTQVGDDGSAWTINAPTAATTSFTANSVPPSETQTASFACTITDASGATADTGNVGATATNFNSGGGEP
jgi:hypothetical protein